MALLDIDTGGIIKQLKNFNQNKAAGLGELLARVLKETAEQIAPIITYIFQQSYDTSTTVFKHWLPQSTHTKIRPC